MLGTRGGDGTARNSRFKRALLVSLSLAGCMFASAAIAQQPKMTNEAPNSSSAPSAVAPAGGAHAPAKQGLRIGMLIPNRTNPFWVAFSNSAQAAAKSLNVDLRIVDYENREEKEIDTLQGLISSGLDGLVVVPHNTQMGPAILDMAERNHIPVTVADRWPGFGPETGKYVGFVGSNDEKAGYDIASELFRQGCTKLVANNAVRGHSGYEARTRGRVKATKEHPEVTVLREEWASSVRAEGTKTTEAWLTAFPGPGFDCLYGGNDDWAMGAWKVLSDRGVADKVKISGLDLIPEVVEKLKQGAFAASAGGHWYEGALAVVQMFDFLNGVKPAQPITVVTDIVITKATAAKFEDQFIKHPMQIDWKQRSRFFNPDAPVGFTVEFKPE